MKKHLDNILRPQRIICFTDDANNPTMWAHYAQCFNGICIGWEIDSIRNFIYSVQYADDVNNMQRLFADYLKNHKDDITSVITAPLLLKLKSCEYEHEYRYIRKYNPHESRRPHKIRCNIKKIIIGINTSQNIIDIIKAMVSKNNKRIELHKLKQDEFNLTLKSEPLSQS